MLRRWTLAILAVACVVTLAGCSSAHNASASGDRTSLAIQFVQSMVDGKFADATKQFDPAVSQAMSAEQILLNAAHKITGDIIEATGVEPYIRADTYDYGVNLRLRYQCRVQDRAEIQYEITRRIFSDLQEDRSVDLAIPYVYSNQAGADQKEAGPREKDAGRIRDIAAELIRNPKAPESPEVIAELAASIAENGLLQPILVVQNPDDGRYDIVAGNARYEACKSLGWKTIPVIVNESSVKQ